MKNQNNNYNSGIGFVGALQVAFIVLKLCKIINWSWLWILSPMWIGFVVSIMFIIFLVFLVGK